MYPSKELSRHHNDIVFETSFDNIIIKTDQWYENRKPNITRCKEIIEFLEKNKDKYTNLKLAAETAILLCERFHDNISKCDNFRTPNFNIKALIDLLTTVIKINDIQSTDSIAFYERILDANDSIWDNYPSIHNKYQKVIKNKCCLFMFPMEHPIKEISYYCNNDMRLLQ